MNSFTGNLTEHQLDGMAQWDRDVMFEDRHRVVGSNLVKRAVDEIRRRRSVIAANEETVRAITRTTCLEILMFDESVEAGQIERIATRVAEQLTVASDCDLSADDIKLIDRALGALASDDNDAPTADIDALRKRLGSRP